VTLFHTWNRCETFVCVLFLVETRCSGVPTTKWNGWHCTINASCTVWMVGNCKMSKNGTEISNKHRPERCDTFLKSFEAGSKTGVLFHTCCPDDDKPVQCTGCELPAGAIVWYGHWCWHTKTWSSYRWSAWMNDIGTVCRVVYYIKCYIKPVVAYSVACYCHHWLLLPPWC